MARQARGKSESGIYHVMLRGNERKSVFLDEKDKNRIIEIMLQKKESATSRLFAFCIMDNHVHMVIQESVNGQPLETLMKRIGVAYAMCFNRKYKQVGYVFQEQFHSEIVAAEFYLFGVISMCIKCGLSGRKVAEIVGVNREKVRRILVSKEPSP